MNTRRLLASDADHYRALRLHGLQAHPAAFGASWEDEACRPLAWFAERLEANAVFGCEAASQLVGVAGLHVPPGAKQRHKGVVWGMFVRAEARGACVGRMLLARVLQHARGVVEEVQLAVAAGNGAALGLYERAGFERYGVEQRALKVDGEYHDEVLMALRLAGGGSLPHP